MTHKHSFLLLFSLSVLLANVWIVNASPVFEPDNGLVEDNAADDAAFAGDERSNDGFPDMNDFNFEPSEGGLGGQKEQDTANQSAEQVDDDSGPPSGGQNAPERPSMMSGDVNKATADEQEGNEGEGSDEKPQRPGPPDGAHGKPKYQDGEESTRSLDQFEPFDKEADMNLDKNEFNDGADEAAGPPGGGGSGAGRGGNSGEEQGAREGHLMIPPPALQIDEPIIVNGPMPMHGGRPPMAGRSNSEENEGDQSNENDENQESLSPSMRDYMNQMTDVSPSSSS